MHYTEVNSHWHVYIHKKKTLYIEYIEQITHSPYKTIVKLTSIR